MTVRDLLPFGKTSVPVNRGVNPIISFQEEMNRLFHDFFGEMSMPSLLRGRESALSIYPAVDVSENDKGFTITAELPGLDAQDIQVDAAEGYLTIKGEKRQEEKEEREGYFRQERSYGAFQRIVAMPDTAHLDKAEASYKNGVLTLSIPKKAGTQNKTHKIEIKQAA